MDTQAVDPRQLRRLIIDQSRRAGVGHIGPALSIAELIALLYGEVLRIPAPRDPERDRFVLSKGHAALALYAALRLKGFISQEQLDTFCADGTLLGVHPERILPGVDFSTGSLGQGLSFGAGAALAARLAGSDRRVFVLVSDAECNEGSLWEAVMFAAHHRLGSLTAIVDDNGQQALGKTAEVLDLRPLAEKWRAFGWQTAEVDGHDPAALRAALAAPHPDAPRVVVARTVCGKGVSFMEGQVKWHYLPMSEGEYRRACAELGAAP
jgi:transketolase